LASYFGLALGPVLLLFLSGTNLIRMSSDRTFAAPVRDVLDKGSQVGQALHREIERRTANEAQQALRGLAGIPVGDPLERPRLDRQMRLLLAQLQLDYLAVFDGLEFVQAVVEPRSGLTDLPEPGRALLTETLREGSATRPAAPIGAGAHMTFGAALQPSTRTLLVAGRRIDPAVARQSEDLIQSFQSFRQMELQRPQLAASAVLLYLLVTLLILLGATWVGLYLARRVTVPIQALAEATRRISEGDLDHRVQVRALDEFEVLVDSFNRMTAEVHRGRELLETTNADLRRLNARLDEERSRIAAVLDNVAAGVLSLDAAGRIGTCNRAALRLLGQEAEQVVGRAVGEAWSDAGHARLAAVVREGLGSSVSRQLPIRAAGATRTVEIKTTPLRDPSGALTGTVLVLEDLTDLLQAQQSAAWSEAAKRIAHEIKNPLTPIQLAAERIAAKSRQNDPGLREAIPDSVAAIVREVASLQRMVDEFSRFARMPRPQPAETDMADLAEETVRLYRHLKPGVEVAIDVAADARIAWIDREQIRGVLVNLLDNALEATEAPGRIEVATRRDGEELEVRVSDSGRGIPAEQRDKLFQPYFSTKGRGTGMGLAIVHRVVSDHGGTIRVEDHRPAGTSFVVRLPQ
jgi:two-component system nitrogen regulation sensor histidine kinase NtrY